MTDSDASDAVATPWRNEKPPNEIWVEVMDGASVFEAMAFYGRDGCRPHWQLRDGSACHPSRFSRWREIPNASLLRRFRDSQLADARSKEEAFFMDFPERWYDDGPIWGCENGHLSKRYLKSEQLGDVCLDCQCPVWLIDPKTTEPQLQAALGIIGDRFGLFIPEKRAELLRDQVLKTWSPPLESGNETTAQVAQTCTMQTLAWVFGKEFLGELTDAQSQAIDQGLALMQKALL